jgi:hypothetical protein
MSACQDFLKNPKVAPYVTLYYKAAIFEKPIVFAAVLLLVLLDL